MIIQPQYTALETKSKLFSSPCFGGAITRFKADGVHAHDLTRAKKKPCTRLVVQGFKSISPVGGDIDGHQSFNNNNNYKEQ